MTSTSQHYGDSNSPSDSPSAQKCANPSALELGPRKKLILVKDSWINPVWKYMEGRILSILNKHGIKGVPTLIHEQQIKGGKYFLQVLSHIITQPVGDLITKFSCLGELLVVFLDYLVAHKDAVEITNILHHDMSLPNLILTPSQGQSTHVKFMQHLPKSTQEALCTRIEGLS
ncbi:hypothetical protein SCLCIDRAFT_33424 [Scleroderma citrinum Foug A]|uniref:Fungal-type protein kinase domain-containing protein n=1 Tax=Scleroderma citrinum Foug A TaxID=1036808 RepID=A0A0C2YP18_9AGAM|nr:hypothetical protein SCLCIDRAFT_33424 [Scleroderma citrinum Foug A]